MSAISLINLTKIENETLDFDEILTDFDIDECKIKGIRFNGKVFNNRGRLELSGWIAFEVITECSKCLKNIVEFMQVEVNEILSSDFEDFDAIFIPKLSLDLQQLANDLISVDLPMAFQCDECSKDESVIENI